MRLSPLQKYILKTCGADNGTGKKEDFYGFYNTAEFSKNKKIIQDTIHKCLESLVARDLAVAYGKKTAQKWFIEKIRLTGQGRQAVKDIIKKRQAKLPIK